MLFFLVIFFSILFSLKFLSEVVWVVVGRMK